MAVTIAIHSMVTPVPNYPIESSCRLLTRWLRAVPADAFGVYFETKGRFAREIKPGLESGVTGQNLIHDQHNEFGPQSIEPRYDLPCGVYAKLTKHFR